LKSVVGIEETCTILCSPFYFVKSPVPNETITGERGPGWGKKFFWRIALLEKVPFGRSRRKITIKEQWRGGLESFGCPLWTGGASFARTKIRLEKFPEGGEINE
jgi:hypothetical protein